MSSEDVDDLYSDLYGDTGAYAAEESPADSKLVESQQQAEPQQQPAPTAAAVATSTPTASSSRSSFIPQTSGGGGGNGGGGASFIPAPSSTPYDAAPAQQGNAQGYRTQDQYGSSGSLASQPANNTGEFKRTSPHEMPDEGKMFIGGLNWETSEEKLARHFGQFGKVVHCTIMKDLTTGRSRGFGFLTFEKAETVNVVLVKEHFLDGKIIDPKRAVSRAEGGKTSRCFVGSIPQSATAQAFEALFKPFGLVTDANLMMDNTTGKPRGYGFVTFADDSTVDAVLAAQPIYLDGKQLDVKRAQPRVERERRPQSIGGREQRGGYGGGIRDSGLSHSISQNSPPPVGGMGAAAGGAFDPQAMAALFQQTGWGNNFNPLMFQQMMMGGAMGNMPMGMPGMGMPGMGMGMGLPQMGTMGQSWGAMPQQSGGYGQQGGMGQQRSSQGYQGGGGQGQRRHSPTAERGGSADLYRPLPRPMGLPARPDVPPPPRPAMEGERNFTGVQPQYVAHEQNDYERRDSRRSRSPTAAKTLAGGNYSDRERSPQRHQGSRDRY